MNRNEIPPVPDPPAAPRTRGVVLTKAAAVYDLLAPAMLFWQEQRINRRLLDAAGLQPDQRVLDIGCATGGLTLAAARRLDRIRGGFAVGLDASPAMVRVARRKTRDLPCRFDIGVAERLPYADNTFHLVTSSLFYHHLDHEDKLASLRETYRVLIPGGVFAIADVDTPTNRFGRLCLLGADLLFHQAEIRENATGLLPRLFPQAGFCDFFRVSGNLGYISTFLMHKPNCE